MEIEMDPMVFNRGSQPDQTISNNYINVPYILDSKNIDSIPVGNVLNQNSRSTNISTTGNEKDNKELQLLEYYYKLRGPKKEKIKKKKELPDFPKQNRTEGGIKHCTVELFAFITKVINLFIKESKYLSDENMHKIKIKKPNSKLFTAKPTVSANLSSLTYLAKYIFTIGKEVNGNRSYQSSNDKNINDILKFIENFENKNFGKITEDLEMIKTVFNLKYSELINIFINSDEFKDFQDDPRTKYFDQENIKRNLPLFAEPKGFLFHLSQYRKERVNKERVNKERENKEIEALFEKAKNQNSLSDAYQILKLICQIQKKNWKP